MSRYSPISGTVTNIAVLPSDRELYSPCSLTMTVQDSYGAVYTVIVEPTAYVLNQAPIGYGDQIIVFYDTMAAAPLIYPPRYRAVAIVKPPYGQYAMLDTFDRELVNSDNTLRVNLSNLTEVRTQNGQIYHGSLGDQLLLVLYSAATRSIPAQTTAESITVFCA